jgi:hypothetical protein
MTRPDGGSENLRKSRMDKDEFGSRHVATSAGMARGGGTVIVGGIGDGRGVGWD